MYVYIYGSTEFLCHTDHATGPPLPDIVATITLPRQLSPAMIVHFVPTRATPPSDATTIALPTLVLMVGPRTAGERRWG